MDQRRSRRPLNNAIKATPYGAATIEQTDPKKLQQSLIQQMTQAGLGRNSGSNLFPKPLRSRDGTLAASPDEGVSRTEGQGPQDTYRIKGVSDAHEIFQQTEILRNLHPVKSPDMCATDQLAQNRMTTKVFTALHETAHHVANSQFQLLVKPVYNAIKEREVSLLTQPIHEKIVQTNTQERLADMSASLYVFSNYGPSFGQTDITQIYSDMRSALSDGFHYTSSSVDLARQKFTENPVKGMTIVETTDWAARILKDQPNVVREALMADRIESHLKGDAPGPETDDAINPAFDPPQDPLLAAQIQHSLQARDRLCIPSSAAKENKTFKPDIKTGPGMRP